MPGRYRKPCVLNPPSWRSKRLLKNDETLQTFSWPYDTGALINEMKHVSEIVLSLSLPSLPLSKYCVCDLSLSKYCACSLSKYGVCVLMYILYFVRIIDRCATRATRKSMR